MNESLAQSDEEFADQVADQVDGARVRSAFAARYGRGWQRKLANNLGIAESTLSGWLKSNEFPTSAKLAIGSLLLRHELRNAPEWRPVKRDDTYAVYAFEGRVGRPVADNIQNEDDAYLIAAAPALLEACKEAWPVFGDARDSMDGWGDLADQLGDAVEAARVPSTSDSPQQSG